MPMRSDRAQEPRAVPGREVAARGDGGFTLLEVMVAFVIAALALGALMQGAGGGLRASRVAAHTQEALSRARSHLAAATLAPVPGEQGGDDGGGYAWRAATSRLLAAPPARGGSAGAGAGGADAPRRSLVLYSVRVTVSWTLDGGRREVSLDTERLGQAALEGP